MLTYVPTLSVGRRKMGGPNNALSAYMNRPDRIKSVLEYYLGEKLPEDWQCREVRGLCTVRSSKGKLSFRQRDFCGEAHAWGTDFRLGIENQNSINLTFPWRLMELDCLTYGAEIEEIQEKGGREKVHYGPEDDFKYRYKKEDVLLPVLNLTLYWGSRRWGHPLCLRDMMGQGQKTVLPKKLWNLAGNYKVNLIHMRYIPETELEKMDSDLKYVLGIMKHSKDKKKFAEYVRRNREFFSRIPKSAVDVIEVFTNMKDVRDRLRFTTNPESGEEETDMCKAWEDIKRDERKQGVKQGAVRVNKLNQLLLADGRQDDLLKSITDVLFQQKLFMEYHI